MRSLVSSLIIYLELNNIKVINTHIGKTICLVLKHTEIDNINNVLTDLFKQITVVEIQSSPAGIYHYLFILK